MGELSSLINPFSHVFLNIESAYYIYAFFIVLSAFFYYFLSSFLSFICGSLSFICG